MNLFLPLFLLICFLNNSRASEWEIGEAPLFCADDEFRCENGEKCIWSGLKCDLIPDCTDESDEKNCDLPVQTPIIKECKSPNFSCDNKCLPPEKVCNGIKDCVWGDDESNCKNTSNAECGYGSCSQLCEKKDSKTICKCAPGYILMEDGFNCRSNASDEPFLLYTNRYDLRLTRLQHQPNQSQQFSLEAESQSLPLLSHLRNAIALDYYFNHTDGSSLLFWSDISLDQIFRGRLHQGILSDVESIVSFGVWTAEGLSVDWIGKHIYWIDSQLGSILVANLDGSMISTLISGNMQNLRALALDPNEGLLFWTDWYDKNPRIESATMAGNKRKVLFQIKSRIINGGWPNGLSCDYILKRLYWIDAKSDSVHSIKYDGSDERQILRDPTHLAHPFSITIFENYFYFTDWRTKNLYKANKFNGAELESIIEENINQPFDLKIVHSSRQATVNNPCLNNTCSHLCLIESSTQHKCACPYLLVLERGDNPKHCVYINQTLLVATKNSISGIDIDQPNDIVFPFLAASRENITALGVYEGKSIVYWADSNTNSIYMLELNTTSKSQPRIFVKSDATNCYGITVDLALGHVFYTGWSGKNLGWIKVASSDGLLRKTLLTSKNNSKIRKPREIVYTNGKLYWFDENRLFRAGANGAKVTELELRPNDVNTTHNARSLIVDDQERLIWTQPHLNVTRLLDLQTMKVHTLMFENSPNTSASLVSVDSFSGEFLFYEEKSGNLSARLSYESNGIRLKNATRLLRSNISNLISMKLMERDALLNEVEFQEERKHCETIGCTHFCIQSFDDRKCSCADGYKLVSNNKCELSNQRLLLLNADYDLNWVSIDQPSTNVHLPIVTNSTSFTFQPRYFALNSKENKLYFIDTKINELWEVNLLTNQYKKLLEGGVSRLSSVAVDANSDYIYASSYLPAVPLKPLSGVIQVLHPIFGDLRKDIVFVVNDTVSSIEIDSRKGFIFWISLNGISRSKLDGSDVKQVISQNRYVSKIALERQNQRLLYLNMAGNTIYSTDYDGKNTKTFPSLFNSTKLAYESIFVQNQVLYFAGQKQLRKVRLSDGLPLNETNELVFNLTSSVLGFQAYLPDDGNVKTSCSSHKCGQFCFNMGENQEFICDCVFSRLNSDGQTCEEYKSFLAFASGSKIQFTTTFDEQKDYKNITIDSELNRDEVQALKPIETQVKAPVALATDTERKFLFVSDIQTEQIVAITFNQTKRIVITQNVRRAEGLAYDEVSKDLYFSSDDAILKVNVKNLDENMPTIKPEIVLQLSENDLVRGLTLNPCEKTIYFTNWRIDYPAIEQVYYNGSSRRALVKSDIQTPNAIVIDHMAKKLYWIDARLDKIERMELENGSNREVVLSAPQNLSFPLWSRAFPAHPFGLALYRNRLYYTDWIHRAVLSVDKLLGNDVSIHREFMTEQPMGLVIVSEDQPLCGSDECSKGKLKCEDKCVLNANGQAKCACSKGSELNEDGLTCKKLPLKDVCENLCYNNGTCISTNGIGECKCLLEFSGIFCEFEKCDGYCGGNGKCSINKFTGLPQCTCNFGFTGIRCDKKMDYCNGFCFNNGTCHESTNGLHCECSRFYYGIRCQNCHSSNGTELVCQNGGHCNSERTSCVCQKGYSGLECQENICSNFKCLNGGECTISDDNLPSCKCPEKFEGQFCEIDFCQRNSNYCKNGGVCAHIVNLNSTQSDGIKCLCPSKFTGNHCEEERKCSDHCLNGATCTTTQNELECHCKKDFYGPRCEYDYRCKLDCIYGECIEVNGSFKCKCPPGIGLITDYIGHKSCAQYIAKSCSELSCVNGECIETMHKNETKPGCLCEDGWGGMLCETPNCYNYCAGDSKCYVMDKHPYCKCGKGLLGARCNQRSSDYDFLHAPLPKRRSMVILLPFVLVILAIVTVAYFSVLKRHGISFIGAQKQFQHVRMMDNDELATEFQNPAFSGDEENPQNDLMNSHLIDTGVYNDTVMRNGSSSNPNRPPTVEQFNLLSKTG